MALSFDRRLQNASTDRFMKVVNMLDAMCKHMDYELKLKNNGISPCRKETPAPGCCITINFNAIATLHWYNALLKQYKVINKKTSKPSLTLFMDNEIFTKDYLFMMIKNAFNMLPFSFTKHLV